MSEVPLKGLCAESGTGLVELLGAGFWVKGSDWGMRVGGEGLFTVWG